MTHHPPHKERPRAETLALRARRKAEAEELGVDAEFISLLVDRFYAKVRADAVLGPIFNTRIEDWPDHLARLKQFWRSILHNSGEFSGNPMAKHLAIPGLDEAHFAHWLELFYETLRELADHPDAVGLVGRRARMIADSLLTGIATKQHGIAGVKAGANLPKP